MFKALFHAGINGAQIDGDAQSGYNQAGLDAGVGAMIRFHKFLSASLCIDYSMKGARQAFVFDPNVPSLQRYQVQWDYVEVPLMLTFHAKNLITLGFGIQPGIMVRYKEWDQNGDDVTYSPPAGQPRIFDLEVVGALHFIIKNNWMLGMKFSYSTLKIRGAYQNNRLNGQYNNILTLEAFYMMNTVKKNKTKGKK